MSRLAEIVQELPPLVEMSADEIDLIEASANEHASKFRSGALKLRLGPDDMCLTPERETKLISFQVMLFIARAKRKIRDDRKVAA